MLSAEPVCSCALSYVQLAHETAGAARTRLSLRPLLLGRRLFPKLGRSAPRECLSSSRPRCAIAHKEPGPIQCFNLCSVPDIVMSTTRRIVGPGSEAATTKLA